MGILDDISDYIGITGAERWSNGDVGTVRKCVWSILILAGAVLTVYILASRISHYADEPTYTVVRKVRLTVHFL